MDEKNLKANIFFSLSPEQKRSFQSYIPTKVYTTEKYVAILVAISQFVMILLFLFGNKLSAASPRSLGYFSLYIFLFIMTCIALVLYPYTVKKKELKQFFWLRRGYTVVLCIWVLGVSYMELVGGKGLSVYCYLIPTTAAVLLMTPVESAVIFGGCWLILVIMAICFSPNHSNSFAYIVNSILVTVLAYYISFRYYRSTAIEFSDHDTISKQYDEIQKKNDLLVELVNVDQLTGLKNRHYLLEKIYPNFEASRKKGYMGMFLMLDIDYFKQYNDLYGHVQGDVCIQKIANLIQKISHEENAISIRYGGEEFLVVKFSKHPFSAEAFAKKLLEAIKKEHIERSDTEQGCVSISAGLWYQKLHSIHHIEQGIKYADEALYEAKNAGRDQIVRSSCFDEMKDMSS